MEHVALEAQKRDGSVSPKDLRKAAKIPAVLYGEGIKPESLTLEYSIFRRVYNKAGENTLIDLKIEGGKDMKVLVHEIQQNPVSGDISHVDFINVRMDKEVDTAVAIVLVGVAPAVAEFQATISQVMDEMKIRCLPKDLIHSVEVDISSLAQIHDMIHAKDVKLPAGVKSMQTPEDVVVTALAPRKEEEAVAAPAADTIPAELKEAQAKEAAEPGSTSDKKKGVEQ